MAIGRKTGGRQKGTLNQRTQIVLEVVEQGGLTPLEYLLSVMRDEAATKPERLEAAKAAAPYVTRAISSIEAEVTNRTRSSREMSDEELPVEIESSLARTYGPEVTKTFGALQRSPDTRMVDAALKALLDDKMEALDKVECPVSWTGVRAVSDVAWLLFALSPAG